MFNLVLTALIFCFFSIAAHASGETLVRSPTFTSIPCQGRTTEIRTEEGNAFNGFGALTLACTDRSDHAQWIIRSEVGCDVESDDEKANIDDACGKDIAKPVGLFHNSPQKQPNVNQYALGRYVFASDCQAVRFTSKRMEAVTNKVTSSSTDVGWVCRQVNKVNSLGNFSSSSDPNAAKSFRYAKIITRGPQEKLEGDAKEELDFSNILGVQATDTHYQVHSARGVAIGN